MARANTTFFDTAFRALTGNDAFPWQQEFFRRLMAGEQLDACSIPTGLGKTAIIAIWLIALVHSVKSKRAAKPIPRRLVYVVNRRTVVDQSTSEAEKIRCRLKGEGDLSDEDRAVVDELRSYLAQLCTADHDEVLAISTLRGQFVDNGQWYADPARASIIVGTVDMIGSRLLFSGYGIGFKSRPLHAGFLGQDTLLVHDEAHLEPAFQRLLVEIRDEQQRCKDFCPLQVMALTATSREQGGDNHDSTFALTDEEQNPPAVIPDPPTKPIHHLWRRIRATKAIHLVPVEDEKRELADTLADLALKFKDSKRPILVFARSVENVERIASRLAKEGQPVLPLTGTLRGLERAQLVDDCVFQQFLPQAGPNEKTAYLVCTSAGEVGVNITADHLVCDLTTFESMAQRFGRVNRFGRSTDTEIHIVHPTTFEEDSYEQARGRTLELLHSLNGEGSPVALGSLNPGARAAAFAPEPTKLPATDILFDSWALTTIRDKLPGRPSVEPYLHGTAEWEPPETHVAWREEVSRIGKNSLVHDKPKDLLEAYPLKPHELLRDRSDRVFKHLALIADRHPDEPVWLVADDGNVETLTLQELADKNHKDRIHSQTIVFPPEVGGLEGGFLNGKSPSANDVVDQFFADAEKTIHRRIRLWDDDPVPAGMRLIRTIDTRPEADDTEEESESPVQRYWRWYELPQAGETEGSQSASRPVRWQPHTDDVSRRLRAMVDKLGLSDELKTALCLAGTFHDLGKKRELWQRSIGNRNPADWLAKSGSRAVGFEITPYRHEFGSLLDLVEKQEFKALRGDMKDLVLHLVAAHHGRARPHFPVDEAFDPDRPQCRADATAAESPRRFARLQRRYGRWGLAYLESLLRAADWAASAQSSELRTGTEEVSR